MGPVGHALRKAWENPAAEFAPTGAEAPCLAVRA
eukprot:CAMPEP_0204042920 /NCGR_PEP_ID=MMETSP0360-20130528/99908_1 /ASSEMBLY_ACC=CAM_ASM_000342 /TAXON_ID=268821 /ORGANISM="Scrippsiella Hangoei, Strain SHTV-5" /LENGTH=33 /DNA_ID= /DNA_START= /DNA_END= /DNA_ORIENTATION=